MSVSRRSFFHTVGAGSAVLSAGFITGRGREAMAFEAVARVPAARRRRLPPHRLERERARPGALDDRRAEERHLAPRRSRLSARLRRRPVGHDRLHVQRRTSDAVIVATGSGPILEAATRAFCTMDKPLVTAAPTFATCEGTARRMGVPVKVIQVDRSLGLDIDGMAAAAKGAGLVFFCNPNNPTGTAHGAATVEKFVRAVKQASPDTKILLDEAYIDYVHDASVKTAAPLTQQLPGVFITRSYSKAHGMAGLRLGYGIGQPETMQAISRAWGLGSINTLTAAAGIASLRDAKHMDEERAENARVRDFTLQAFRDLGYEGTDANTNCIFVDIKRPAKEFRDACAAQKVRVGRDFPPFEKSHTRVSLGTMDEMKRAVAVFRQVLTTSTASRAQ